MTTSASDKNFVGSMPAIYEAYLVPLIFEQYAADLVRRLATLAPPRILEVAAGTGAVTRAMAAGLPASTAIVASDLNQAMLVEAGKRGTTRPVEWRQADCLQLPFGDGEFDAVVCQFGAMFLPDKAKGFAEVRRVLRPGGTFIFSVWDRIEENAFADVITSALGEAFPSDPPRFLPRTPYGYNDRATIERDVAAGGFTAPAAIETRAERSRAASPREPATGFCQGTPLRAEIEARTPGGLDAATDTAAEAIAKRHGSGAVDAKIQAVIVTAVK